MFIYVVEQRSQGSFMNYVDRWTKNDTCCRRSGYNFSKWRQVGGQKKYKIMSTYRMTPSQPAMLTHSRSLIDQIQWMCAITLNYCTYTNHVGVSPRALYCVVDTSYGLGRSLRHCRPALPKGRKYQMVKAQTQSHDRRPVV